MLKLTLFSILLFYLHHHDQVQGYGYRYNYNPGTGDTNLWTFLPGHEQPVVYDFHGGVTDYRTEWPQVYTVAYDGLLPGQPVIPGSSWNDNPNLYRYKGPDGKFRYKCKPEAYYSEFQKKCIWKPSYHARKRLRGLN